jgi:hypothetical protein
MAQALEQAGPGDLVVIQTEDEDVEPTLDFVDKLINREETLVQSPLVDRGERGPVAPSSSR